MRSFSGVCARRGRRGGGNDLTLLEEILVEA